MYSFLEITDVSIYLFDIIFGAFIDMSCVWYSNH